MRNRKKSSRPAIRLVSILVCVVLLLVVFGSCGALGGDDTQADSSSLPGVSAAQAVNGSGYVTMSSDILDDEQLAADAQSAVTTYMTHYYTALGNLEVSSFPQDIFAQSADNQRALEAYVLEYMVELRGMGNNDLSLVSYTYHLKLQSAEYQYDDSISMVFLEDSVQNFSLCPEVDSCLYGMQHSFTFEQDGDGVWRIAAHETDSRLYALFTTDDPEVLQTPLSDESLSYADRMELLIEQARAAADNRSITITSLGGQAETPDHEYDRAAAVAYANEWITQRNEMVWGVYDELGGNCQNFASQCIYAGGIPMDTEGELVWKWYGSEPDFTNAAAGRSQSWSDVGYFAEYAAGNEGSGLCALFDAPYYEGQPGDLIHMTLFGEYVHTVVITSVLYNENGGVADYLIASNTANYRNFPVGAYAYSEQTLIRILGWND